MTIESSPPPARPQSADLGQASVLEPDPLTESNLFDGDTYDHLLFDLHALGTYTHHVAEKNLPLSPKQQSWIVRHARHTFLNVYRRLFTVLFLLNFILVLPIIVGK